MNDIMQDYAYYETHATDVKLTAITSDEDNADLLARLRDEDPELTCMCINIPPDDYYHFAIREGDDLGWLGYFIGRSNKLERIWIENFPDNINMNSFFKGLGRNRSIQDLFICKDLGESFHSLVPFLRNNDSLSLLVFLGFNIGLQCARSIALLLGQSGSITRLHFEDVDFDHEGFLRITAALRSLPQIEDLGLSSINIVRDGYVALGNALESCSSLRWLELRTYDNNIDDQGFIDDEGLQALVAGLKHCHNLISLNLYGKLMITEEGSRSLSTLFQSDNCRLEYLDLGRMSIDNDGMDVLVMGLASLSSLKKLNLSGVSIDNQGLQDLSRGLINCNLEELDLSGNMLMESVSGLRALGALVRRRMSMRSLKLSDCSIMDEGLQSFVEGVAYCCNLTGLNLSGNRSITANGLASLSSLLEHCSLCTLDLFGINIGDDGAAALAGGLIGNNSLTNLKFDVSISGITARGWAAFSKLLCDTSSVNSTYLSNHALVQIGGYRTPSDIVQYLNLNKYHNQAAAIAICKILHSHPDIDVMPLFEFNLMCLPLVVEWFEKAKSYLDNVKESADTWPYSILSNVNESSEVFQCRQPSAVYKLIRGMPLLAANGFRSQKMKDVPLQSKSKKRTYHKTL